MQEYLNLLKYVLKNGEKKIDRTGTGTLSSFGLQTVIDMRNGFPLLTTKKMFTKAIVHELLWFIKGSTNISYLVKNDVRIWNEWPFAKYQQSENYQNETMEEFAAKIKTDETFAKIWGDLGPVYGKQWRNFNEVDQLKNVIHQIKTDPNSRRIIMSAWNPGEIKDMLLPPCHILVQFYVSKSKYLSLKLYQRSADLFLGVPFNIASYSLLLALVAKECNLKPLHFIHSFGDAHIYLDHMNVVEEQIDRKVLPLCELVLNPEITSIFDYTYNDIKFENYFSHSALKAKVSV